VVIWIFEIGMVGTCFDFAIDGSLVGICCGFLFVLLILIVLYWVNVGNMFWRLKNNNGSN